MTERVLLIKVVLLLGVVRLGLSLLPFWAVWRLLNRAAEVSIASAAADPFPPSRIAQAVTMSSPYVLGARPCLAQALAVRLLLRRRGYPARLRLGVARGEEGRLQAHAWVEVHDRVVIGGSPSALERYVPLLPLDLGTA